MQNINPYLESLPVDYLYHLGLDTSLDLKKIFGDTKFVCMGGSAERALTFAEKVKNELESPLHPIGKTERFSLYKVGPVISVSHGMGMPSLMILLHEITKLLHYAACHDPIYIRIGTSGGIGLPGGTVVVTQEGLNGKLEPYYELPVLGEVRRYPTTFDKALIQNIVDCKNDLDVRVGKTLGVDCFYEGQGRLDGALNPGYTEDQKLDFLKRLHSLGVRNIEMEACAVGAFCNRAGIRGAVVCATLLDRLQGDQVTSTKEQLVEFSDRAQKVVVNFIKKSI